MSRLLSYFARGCLALVPLALTAYILWTVVTVADDLLGLRVPGLGLLFTVGLTTVVGFLLSNVVGRRLYATYDRVLAKVPIVKLLYSSIRDLVQTLVSEKASIGQPVAVRLSAESETRFLGLLTRQDLSLLGLPDHVAVYLPQAYNIGGQVLAVHKSQIEQVPVSASEMLTFMMSGGASGLSSPATAIRLPDAP